LQEDNEQDQSRFFTDYQEAIQIINQLPDTSEIKLHALSNLLLPLFKNAAHQETIRQSEKIIEIINSRKKEFSHNPVGEVYYRLANANGILGKTDTAISFYKKIIFLREDDHDKLHKASMINNAGMIWSEIGEPDSAMVYFQYALDIVKEFPDSTMFVMFEGSILDNIATIYEERGEFDKTIPIHENNILRYENTDDYFRWINSGISLMNAEREMRNYPRVNLLYEQFSPIIDTLTYPHYQTNNLNMFKVFSRYFSEIGDFINAYTWHVKATRLSDSVTIKDNLLRDRTAKQLTLLKNKQFELQLQEEILGREKEKKLARLGLWIIILMTFCIIFTLFSFYSYYKQRLQFQAKRNKLNITNLLLTEERLKTNEQEKRLVEIKLKNKKKDLAEMAISLLQKKEWALELNQHLLIIESSKGNKRKRELIKLKDNVRRQIYVNKQTDLLRENIDLLSAEYYEKLSVEFPALTKTEMKLCSFTRLKLTIAQVADLQNIDTASVVVARYRLKKKLGLEKNQNLDEFLQSF